MHIDRDETVNIKIEEIVKQYGFKERQHQLDSNRDHEVEYRYWPHPATAVSIKEIETNEEPTISAYTDGSKSEEGVGAGVVLYNGSNTMANMKLKLADRCSNNQAELLAIYKALEMIKLLNKDCYYPHTAIIYTDSRVAIDSILNTKNHSYLAEETRQMIADLDRKEWGIKFSWVRAHAGTLGNETADRIAKEAARNTDMKCDFDRIPKSTIYREAEEEAMQKWQQEWTTSHKAAATRQYFPTIQHRLRSKIKLTPKMTAVLTGHGMTKAYLHRFHLIDEAKCSCGEEYQSMDHLLFHCPNLSAQREVIKQQIGTWPASKEDLVSKYQKEFSDFVNAIDFDAIQQNG